MNLELLVTDNVAELLVIIIEFTQNRQRILTQNINGIQSCGFVPMDLAVEEFCSLINTAIQEHSRNRRLLFCDTENIKFGTAGRLKVQPTIDRYAQKLLGEDCEEYLEFQINKLLENSLNQRVAAELLRQKQESISIVE